MKACTQPAYADKSEAAKAANFLKDTRKLKLYPHPCPVCRQWHLHTKAVI